MMKYTKQITYSLLLIYSFIYMDVFAQSDEPIQALKNTHNSSEKINILRQIIEQYKNIQNDTAYFYCKQAQIIALEMNDKKLVNEFQLKEAELNRFIGNYLYSIKLTESSIEKSKEYKDKNTLANGYLLLGKIHLDLSIIDASYQNAMYALPLFQDLKNYRGEREVINLLGCILLAENKSEESIPYFQKAHRMDSIHGFIDFLAMDYTNLGLAYARCGNLDEARNLFYKSLEISKKNNFSLSTMTALLNLVDIYIQANDYKASLACALEALELAKNYEHKKRWVESTYIVGYIYSKIGDYDKTISYLTEAEELSKEYGFLELTKAITLLLSDFYYETKDCEKAYYYRTLSSFYSDSLAIKQNIDNLNRLRHETKYVQEEKERQWQNKIRNLIFGLTLFLVTIVCFFLLNRQKLKAKNTELEKQNLSNQLEHKNKEIVTKIMFLRKKNEAIGTIAHNLLESKHIFKEENQGVINNVVQELYDACKDESWKEFELRFEEVHTDFFKKLNERFSNLTQNEKRLCAYLRLNISNKDIAALLYLSLSAVESARYRLRKKLNINNTSIDIVDFLEKL